MGTRQQELENPQSCFNKAAPDEPLFVLRANDELAPETLREWAWDYKTQKKRASRYGPEQQKKFEEALALAAAMNQWKAVHP